MAGSRHAEIPPLLFLDLKSGQRLLQVGQQVVAVLDSDRQPYIAGGYTGGELVIYRQLGVTTRK